MNRWLLIISFVLLVAVAFYLFIPSLAPSPYAAAANCTSSAATRHMINQANWQWWPGKKVSENHYEFHACDYQITKILLNRIQLTIVDGTHRLDGFLQFEGYGKDSTLFTWNPDQHLSAKPTERIRDFFAVRRMNRNAHRLIDSLQHFFDQEKNVYGMNITLERITDSSLISMKNSYDHYPSVAEIYSMIDSLKGYIAAHEGKENNFPMLNVRKRGEHRYDAMVAVPTTWDLPASGRFELKKMVLGVNLVGEVRGGTATVILAENEMANYASDYRKVSPAIPFQSLVTNRIAEPDTTKWVTKVCYPVFQ